MDNNGTKKLISVKSFSPEELRKWQMKLLEILVYFRDFCEAHKLRFYLSAGTCLGAVRHHGFIPWDDDLDVAMPRPDYDKLLELWDKEADTSKFICSVTNKERCARFPMATIRSVNTTCIYDHSVNDDICQGLKIDVEFLDGVPENRIHALFNKVCARVFALLNAQRVPMRFGNDFQRKASKWILRIISNKNIRWKVSKWCERRIKAIPFYSDCKYVRDLGVRPFLKEAYSDVIYMDFEGYKMPIPKGYDNHLKSLYGNYMELPPLEKRQPATDNLVFYDLDHSYLDYRGKYYCIES